MTDFTSLLFNTKIGVWTFKYTPIDGGRRTAKNVPRDAARTAADRVAAQTWATKGLVVYRNTGVWPGADVAVPPTLPVVTLEALGPRWIDWLRARNTSGEGAETTTDGYERILKNCLYKHPIAKKPIQEIGTEDAEAFVEDASKGREPNTGRNRAATVTALFRWARSRDARPWMGPIKLAMNPMRDELVRALVPSKGSKASQQNVVVALPKERFEALVTCPSPAISAFRRIWYTFAITSGLRFAEQAGLSWMHLHLEGSRCPRHGCQAPATIPHLHVDRQLTKKLAFTPPKRNSVRVIPLHPLTVEAFLWWRDAGWRGHVGKKQEPGDPVFPGLSGAYVYHQHLARGLRADLVEAELPARVDGFNLDIHSLRRAFLTMLADAGVEDSVRVVLGGHKAKTVTDRHYTARNLPRFVPAIEALRFEGIGELADMMPDEDARAA